MERNYHQIKTIKKIFKIGLSNDWLLRQKSKYSIVESKIPKDFVLINDEKFKAKIYFQ